MNTSDVRLLKLDNIWNTLDTQRPNVFFSDF